MAINEKEAISCLRILVCMARVDGKVTIEEKAVLQDVLRGIRMPEGVTVDTMLEEDINLDYQITQLESASSREQAFLAAFNLANADGHQSEEELELLQRLKIELQIPKEKIALWGRILGESRKSFLPSTIVKIEDPESRQTEIERGILKYSILCGALGSFPVPVVGLGADIAIVSLQVKMIRDVGQFFGHKVENKAAKSLIYNAAGSTVTRIAVRNLVRSVPIWGNAVGAQGAFSATWGLGFVANKFFESDEKLDASGLSETFKTSQKEGEKNFKEHAEKVTAKQKKAEEHVRNLSEALEAGQISSEEYEKKIERLA